jgi:peroxiredoxin
MTAVFYFFQRAWRERDGWFVLALLAISLAANVYLGTKATFSHGAAAPALVAGMKAPRLYAEEINGTKVAIDWSSDTRPTLLYVFSPSCVWCQRNFANFEALSRARKSDFRIIGLSTSSEGLKKYVEEHKLGYTVYTNPDFAKDRDLLRGTPTTFLISPEATIKEVWGGAYTGSMKEQIEARLGVKLPGLIVVPHAE